MNTDSKDSSNNCCNDEIDDISYVTEESNEKSSGYWLDESSGNDTEYSFMRPKNQEDSIILNKDFAMKSLLN